MKSKRPRTHILITALMIFTILLTLPGCNSTGGGDETSAGGESSTEEQPPTGEISITIVNATDVDICVVSATVKETNDFLDNILEETLAPGDSFSIADLEPMTVDLIAQDCAGETINTANGTIVDGPVTWEITLVGVASYELPAPPPTSPDQTWLVMLYVDGDDELLEDAFYLDLNEAELVGSSDQVHVVAQVDRFEGGFAGDGDWTTAKRFYLTQDADINVVNSEEVMDIGEVNMADADTLADFITWAVQTYPADKYVLILSDHGSGWYGGWYDQTAPGDWITPLELTSALAYVQQNTSLEQLELIGFDACLMSSLEIYSAIWPYARYAVASEEVEPSFGWAYGAFLSDLANNPGMSGADLAFSIVQQYMDGDILASYISTEYLDIRKSGITMSAVDLAAIPDLLAALDELLIAASDIDQTTVARVRSYTQSYLNTFEGLREYFGVSIPPSYLDLGHMAQMLAEEDGSAAITQASGQLLAILEQAVIVERHGPLRPGSNGISLYFPNSTLYGAYDLLPGSYVYSILDEEFARQSLWDDFLLFHYTGAPMPGAGAGVVASADENADITGPGVGRIEIAPISVSSNVLPAQGSISVSTEVTGGNVAWVNIIWGSYDPAANAAIILQSFPYEPALHDVGGVVYPDWPGMTENGVITLEGQVDADSLVITNGQAAAFATFTQETYGSSISVVYGIHTSAATGERRPAMLRFDVDSTEMLNMLVFTNEGEASVPREYEPQPGDQFTVTFTSLNLATGEMSLVNGDTLTFGDQPFWVDVAVPPPGKYFLGITAVDLDGNPYQQAIELTLEE